MRGAAALLALASTLLAAGGAAAALTSSSWEISLSGGSPAGSLMSVSAVDDDLAWAVGRKDGRGVVMRGDGTRWSKDPAPGLPDVGEWSSVAAVAAGDVWACGTVLRDQALVHFDGRRWTVLPTVGRADDSLPEVPLDDVPGRLFKGGDALHTYAGGAWQTSGLPEQVHIRGIDASRRTTRTPPA